MFFLRLENIEVNFFWNLRGNRNMALSQWECAFMGYFTEDTRDFLNANLIVIEHFRILGFGLELACSWG